MKKLILSAKRQNGQIVYFWHDKNSCNQGGASWSESPSMAFDLSQEENISAKLDGLQKSFLGLSEWRLEQVGE